MILPKLALGIFLSVIGIISFQLPQHTQGAEHAVLAHLLPYVTTVEQKKEVATTVPAKVPAHVTPTESAQILGGSTKIALTPTPTPTRVVLTPTPTIVRPVVTTAPVVIPVKVPTATPTPQVTQPTNDVQSFIMQAINDYRHANGLGSVTTNSLTCNFAATRAQEITSDFSHAGFISRLNAHTLPYPNYSLVTENLAETSNYKDVVNLWANSPEHAANMRANTPFICVEQSGNYYAMEGWKSL